MNKRKLLTGTAVVLSVLILIGAIFIFGRIQADRAQNDFLDTLLRDAGRYDEQSILFSCKSESEAQQLAALYGARLRLSSSGKLAQLTLPEGTTILDAVALEESKAYIDRLSADYHVSLASEDSRPDLFPSAPEITLSNDLFKMQDHFNYLNMGSVWDKTQGQCTVAVIDTGIDTDHPDFQYRISDKSYNASEDKVVAHYEDWSLIEDEHGHGTQVAGIIGANGQVAGVAPGVELLIIKMECNEFGDFNRISDLLFALYYAIEQDAAVINMSFGVELACIPKDLSRELESALLLAHDSDIACVAAAGNRNTSEPMFPACSGNVIGVGALNTQWELEEYSNYGENVNICAPGTAYTTAIGGEYTTATGTSMSAPMVAGAIALHLYDNPYANIATVIDILYASAYDLGPLGLDWNYGYGALDVSDFIEAPRGTITFEMLTGELEDETRLYVQGHSLQVMPEPERLYAVFDGWYYDAKCTQEYVYYSDTFYKDITLYAKWVNESDGIPYTYTVLEDGTVEITSYTGRRRYISVPAIINGKPVTSIGERAFTDNQQLRQVSLPDSITKISKYAFFGCSNLVSIELPKELQIIEEYAFIGCIRMNSVAFTGNALREIGDFAFRNCCNLKRIELPSSVESINGSAFVGATSLREIALRTGNPYFRSADGVLYNQDHTILVCFPVNHSTSFTIPTSVTTIGKYAFAYSKIRQIDLNQVHTLMESAFMNSAIQTITLPDTLTTLGEFGFFDCRNLKEVVLSNNLNFISGAAFQYCTSLTQIQIPAGVTSIGFGAFASSGLQEITFAPGSKLADIGTEAFARSNLKSIEIPDPVTIIFNSAFQQTPLTTITFGSNSRLTEISEKAFSSCNNLTSITLPASVETIGHLAFAHSGLETLYIPKSVSKLDDGAVAYCSRLYDLTVDPENPYYYERNNVVYTEDMSVLVAYAAGSSRSDYTVNNNYLQPTKAIAPYAFAGAYRLRSVQLPATLVDIGAYAFTSSGLMSLHLPDSIITIGGYALFGTDYLEEITFGEACQLKRIGIYAFCGAGIRRITIPASVQSVAQYAFSYCDNLREVTFAENSQLESLTAYVFYACPNLYRVTFLSGSSLTHLQAHCFDGIESLNVVDFGDAPLTDIDNFAFRYCKNLAPITLPHTLKNIGRFAFHGCERLADLVIPASIEHIGSFAFLDTKDLSVFFTSDTLPRYLDEDWDHSLTGYYTGVVSVETKGDYKIANLTTGNVAILQYFGTDTQIDLTAVDLGAPIQTIGGSAFRDLPITSIALPQSLTAIQAEAFRGTALQSIVIPANVAFLGREAFAFTPVESVQFGTGSQLEVIEQYAFEGTDRLTSIHLPSSLTTLGTGVFFESGLSSVTFAPNIGLTTIPKDAFRGTKLTAVTLPDSITLVDHNAFHSVSTLKSVTFGSSELQLMSYAFYKTGLIQLHIPENVSYIGEFCFVGLSGLKEITVSGANTSYKAIDGLLLSADGRKLIAVPSGRTGSLTVPACVEEIGFGAFMDSALSKIRFLPDANILTIGNQAFMNAGNITDITIPASVIALDYYAFAYCSSLETVTFESNDNLYGIYEGAFLGCDQLSNINLPSSVIDISDFAFYSCPQIDGIPMSNTENLQRIGAYAFAYTATKGELSLPESLTDIDDHAFMGNAITVIHISNLQQEVLQLGIGVFADCRQLESITIPFLGSQIDDSRFTWFGYIFGAGAYEGNPVYVPASLKHVTINGEITFLGVGAFADLTNLETIDLPGTITTLYDYAMRGTTARYMLTNTITIHKPDSNIVSSHYFGKGISGHLVLNDEIEGFSHNAFSDCVHLESITLPAGVTTLPTLLFSDCTSLKTIVIPYGVNTIRNSFSGCSALEEIALPNSVTTLESHCFYGCTSLQKVTLSENLKTIGDYTFQNCTSLQEIVIPDSVTEVGWYAFKNCSNLMRLTLGSNLQSHHVSTIVFSNCKNLVEITNRSYFISLKLGSGIAKYARSIINPDGSKTYYDNITNFTFVDTLDGLRFTCEDENYTLVTYLGNEETVTLPATINGHSYSIYKLENVTHLVLSEGITSISDYAFAGCTTLRSISLPSTLTTIGTDLFSECIALEAIDIPSLENWLNLQESSNYSWFISAPYDLYVGGELLTEAVIPESITSIRDSAFYHCRSLQKVQFHDGVTSIGKSAFSHCTALYAINLPDSVTALGNNAFSNCTALRSAVVGNGVTVISDYAFQNCTSLSHVIIGNRVNIIGDRSFAGCDALNELYVPSSVYSIGHNPHLLHTYAFPLHTKVTFEDSYRFAYENGILYTNGKTAIDTMHSSVSGAVVLPDTLTALSDWTFSIGQITSLTIPDSVTSIRGNPFASIDVLTEIIISDDHPALRMVDGVLYNKEMTELYWISPEHEGALVIAEGVTEIPFELVYMKRNITSITLPNSFTQNSSELHFSFCDSLKEVHLGNAIDASIISFHDCAALESITVADGHPYLISQDGILYDTRTQCALFVPDNISGVITVPEGIETVSLSGSNQITGVILPSSVRSADLSYCTNLKSVQLSEGITSVNFNGCAALEEIALPNSLTEIPNNAFSSCTSLKTITLGNAVTSIGSYAFSNCESLQEIIIPDSVTYLGTGTFSGCTSLRTAVIGNSVTELPSSLFDSCKQMTSVTLGNNVQQICSGAFYYCTNLKTITLPASLAYLDRDAFNGCYYLYEVRNLSDCQLSFDDLYYTKVIIEKNGKVRYKDPNSGFTMFKTEDDFWFYQEGGRYYLFYYAGTDSTVTLPKDIQGHSYELSLFDGAEHVIVPEGITYLGANPFQSYQLQTLTLPNSLRSDNFYITSAASLSRIIVSDDNPNFRVVDGILYDNPTTQILWMPYVLSGHITIPEGITEFGLGYAHDVSGITGITLPSTLEYIGYGAFQKCTALTEIRIPDSVHTIEEKAFENTGIMANPKYKKDGLTIVDGWLIDVEEDVEIIFHIDGLRGISMDAYNDCHVLKCAIWGGNAYMLPNVETLFVTNADMIRGDVTYMPTLKHIVYLDTDLPDYFEPQVPENGTAFVAGRLEKLRWDRLYPDLKGQSVIYKDDWIFSYFYDENGELLQVIPWTIWQVIRRPILLPESTEVYENTFIGWDLDGDGQPDSLPANSATDIHAQAIIRSALKEYTVTFRDSDGTVYHQVTQAYGSPIVLPAAPSVGEQLFEGWNGYKDGMIVTGDVEFTAIWHTHYYTSVFTAPTCTEKGYMTHTCFGCGDSYQSDFVDALPHNYVAVETWPTCTEQGYTTYTCSDCGVSYQGDFVETLPHSYNTEYTAPSCTTQGYTTHICVNCGNRFTDEFLDPIGHSFTLYTSNHDATCTTDGTKTAFCDYDCGTEDTIADPGTAAGHLYGEWYTVTPPTLEAEGMRRRDCFCGHFEEDIISKLEGPTQIVTEVYRVADGYVYGVSAMTTVNAFLANFPDAAFLTVYQGEALLSGDALVGSGCEVRLIVNGQTLQTVTVIISGDINGDGKISITDMIAAKAHLLKKALLTDFAALAADVNGDGNISITDFIKIKAHLLDKEQITPLA